MDSFLFDKFSIDNHRDHRVSIIFSEELSGAERRRLEREILARVEGTVVGLTGNPIHFDLMVDLEGVSE